MVSISSGVDVIEDPILLSGIINFETASIRSVKLGKSFVRTEYLGSNLALYYFNPNGFSLFHIVLSHIVISPGHGNHYAIYNNGSTKERFVDYLLNNYPDHFEWLLFHPEWFL